MKYPLKKDTQERHGCGEMFVDGYSLDAVLKHVLASKSYETEIFFTGEIEEVTWSQVNVILFVCLAGTHYTIEFLNTRYLSVHLLKVIKRKD